MAERLTLGKGNARISYEKMRNFMVEAYFDDLKHTPDAFEAGVGYIKDGMVYVYEEHKSKTTQYPWFTWDRKKKEYIFAEENIHNKHAFKSFKEENVRDISMEKIMSELQEKENLYDEEEIRFINAAASKWEPIFNDADDFLKKTVKRMLYQLDVNVNSFNNKFPKKYQVVNMKSALNGKTKTSTTMFSIWFELMKGEFILIAKSQRSAPIKLDGYVVYRSQEDRAYYTKELTEKDLE